MCIVVVKPAGIDMPAKKTISQCFESNSDGAGFMMLRPNSNKVFLDKGFMTLEAFNKALNKQSPSKEDMVVMHFRITTSGGTNTQMCHPFPVSGDEKTIKALRGEFDGVCFAHNGIITSLNGSEKDMSDTAILSRDYLSDEAVYNNLYESCAIQELIKEFIGYSKLAFLHPVKGLLLLGDFVKDKGVYYSNTTYKTYKKAAYSGSWLGGGYSKSHNNYYGRDYDYDYPPIWTVCVKCDKHKPCDYIEDVGRVCMDCADKLNENKKADVPECDSCCETTTHTTHNIQYDVWLCDSCWGCWEKDSLIEGAQHVPDHTIKGVSCCNKHGCTLLAPCKECIAYDKKKQLGSSIGKHHNKQK